MLRNCPTSEKLLEWVSIAEELSNIQKASLKVHCTFCKSCRDKVKSLENTWKNFLSPEEDITSSLLSIYSRLQKDETLILQGWKLDRSRVKKEPSFLMSWAGNYGFQSGVFAVLFVGLVYFTFNSNRTEPKNSTVTNTNPSTNTSSFSAPYARFRMEDKNTVRVKYVEPELLQSVEFETTGNRR